MPQQDFRPQVSAAFIFLLCAGYFFAHLLAFWPGMLSIDGFDYIHQINFMARAAGDLNYESRLYGALLFYLAKLDPVLTYVSLLQILLAAGTITYGHYLVSRRLRMPVAALFGAAFLVFTPNNAWMVIHSERDILFSWLGLLMMLQLIDLSLPTTAAASLPRRMIPLALTAVLAAGLRREGLLLLAVLVPQVYLLRRPARAVWLSLFGSAAVWSGLLLLLLPTPLDQRDLYQVRDQYAVRNLVYPVLYILQRREKPLGEAERQILEPVIDMSDLGSWAPNELAHPKFVESTAQKNAFLWYGLELIVKNFGIFLEFKFLSLRSLFSLAFVTTYKPSGSEFDKNVVEPLRAKFPLLESRWPWLRDQDLAIEDAMSRSWLFYPLATPLVGCVSLLMAFFLWPWANRAAAVALGPFLHAVMVVLSQPQGKPKYLYLTFLVPAFLLPYLYWDLRSGRKRPANRG